MRCLRSDLSIRFKQLFKYFNVRHAPTRCRCAQSVLRRQATKDARPTGYYLRVEVPKSMNLDQAISRAMWEKLARERICPECKDRTGPVHDFDKFAYLPEMLVIHALFLDRSDGRDNNKVTTDEKLTYPQRLDMSAFRDDPNRPGDRTDCIYRLQSIIHTDPGSETLPPSLKVVKYKAALRVNDAEFAQFQYLGAADSFPDFITFEEVNEVSNGVPHVLMYVRERNAEAGDDTPDAIEPEPTKPRGGTSSQPKPQVKCPTSTIHASDYCTDNNKLQRFVEAQEGKLMGSSLYETATSNLENGSVSGRWMWQMFPPCVFPGTNPGKDRMGNPIHECRDYAEEYVIRDLAEARAYWNHPLLKERYHELVEIVRWNPEPNLDRLFRDPDNADHFLASLTLFTLICRDDRESHELFEGVFLKFGRNLHQATVYQVIRWLKEEDNNEATAEVLEYIRTNSEQSANPGSRGNDDQETAGRVPVGSPTGASGTGTITPATHNNNSGRSEKPVADKNAVKDRNSATTGQPASANTDGHGNGHGISTTQNPAQRIGAKLLSLADQESAYSEFEHEKPISSEWHGMSRKIGRAILSFGLPEGMAAPVSTSESEERAHRLGQHLMSFALSQNNPSPDEPREASASSPVGGFGLDGSSDEPDDDNDLYGEFFKAVAIPTDPRDPRIEACQNWTLEELKKEFQKEQLDWRGLRADPEKHRVKFRKHFELERDYSIYHEGRLRQAMENTGIRMRRVAKKGDKIDKAELVDALTNYDTQRLQEAGYVEGDESEDTESVAYDSEPYQSSEASGTEAKYLERERAAFAAARKAEVTPARPRVVAATARAQKRVRDEDEYEEEEDDDDDDDELFPRPPSRSPVRMRTRY